MAREFKYVGIIGSHHNNPCVADTVQYIESLLSKHAKTLVETETAKNLENKLTKTYSLEYIAKNCDLAVIIGGDGSFLNTGRNLSIMGNIPIVGINRGKLGFLTDIAPEEATQRLLPILKGNYRQEQRFMLQASVKRQKKTYQTMVALNDIVIDAGKHNKLFQMDVNINERYAFDQRADGIIIATPTGSTAHALSAGGSIMHPSLEAVVLVPMFSHSLSSRPIIIDASSKIRISISEHNNPKPILSFDGHTKATLSPNDCVHIEQCEKYVTILHPLDYDYFSTLRSKLHWGKKLFP